MGNFRLAYPATIPFSKAVTIILCVLYVLGFSGLLVFNFLTQAKIRRCATYTSGIYYPDSCDAGTLEFARTYYSRPVDDVKGQSGVFPWTPLGFGLGGDTGPVDYSLLRTNWTGQSMSCIMYEQIVTLHLDSGGWTVAACYYCGGSLRLLCTTLDSERTQLAGDPASSRVDVGGAMTAFRNSIQTVATTAFEGAIVLSARMIVKRAVSSQFVQPSTLPHNTSSSIVILGTTIGSGVIYANDTSAAIAGLAADGLAISTLAEQSTAEDIQPEGTPRTLQASYLCRRCENEYKPTLEIVAVVGAAIFAILTPAFAAARLVAELLAPKKDNSSSLEASSLPGTDPSYKPAATPGNQYAGQASPLMYQPYNSYNHY